MHSRRKCGVIGVITLLMAAPVMHAAADLKIRVAEGDGAFNNIKQRLGRNIKVEVKDERGVPVPNAAVTFLAPAVGPSVTFGTTGNKYETKTDANGIATTVKVTPNSYEGRFRIRVTVASDGAEQTAVLAQSNTSAGGIEDPKSSGRGRKTALLLGLLGGGAAVGVTLGMRGGSSSGSGAAPPTSLNIGGISVGGPR